MLIVGLLMIQISAPHGIDSIGSLGTWLVILSSILAFTFALLKKRYLEIDKALVILLIIYVIFVAIITLDFSYRKLVSIGCFLEIPLFFASYNKIQKRKIEATIYYSFVVLSLYYILLSFTSMAYVFETQYGIVSHAALTLGYNNPNETAMYLFYCSVVIVAAAFWTNKKLFRVFLVCDYIFLLYLITRTHSRTCLMASLIFIVLVFVYKKKRIPNYLGYITVIFPFVFIILTLLFENRLSNLEFFWGKAFETGRYDIYMRAFENQSVIKFLIGDFEFLFQNLHNGYVSIFATIGAIGLALFITIFNYKLKEVHNKISNYKNHNIFLIGLLCVLLISATEAASICAGSAFAASVISIYLLAIAHEEENAHENTAN